MIKVLTDLYGKLLRGLIVLAAAGAISAVSVEKAAKTAGQSVQKGLISLKALNAQLGM